MIWLAVKGKDFVMAQPEAKALTSERELGGDAIESIDDDEPTSAELVEMLKQSLYEAKIGKTRPARKVMKELDEIVAEYDAKS